MMHQERQGRPGVPGAGGQVVILGLIGRLVRRLTRAGQATSQPDLAIQHYGMQLLHRERRSGPQLPAGMRGSFGGPAGGMCGGVAGGAAPDKPTADAGDDQHQCGQAGQQPPVQAGWPLSAGWRAARCLLTHRAGWRRRGGDALLGGGSLAGGSGGGSLAAGLGGNGLAASGRRSGGGSGAGGGCGGGSGRGAGQNRGGVGGGGLRGGGGAAEQGDAGGIGELAAGLVAVGGVLGQGLSHHLVDVRGQAGPHGAGGGGHLLHVGPDDGGIDVLGEGDPAGQALIQHAPQGVDVGPAIDRFALDLFGGDVVDGAHELAGRGQPTA